MSKRKTSGPSRLDIAEANANRVHAWVVENPGRTVSHMVKVLNLTNTQVCRALKRLAAAHRVRKSGTVRVVRAGDGAACPYDAWFPADPEVAPAKKSARNPVMDDRRCGQDLQTLLAVQIRTPVRG